MEKVICLLLSGGLRVLNSVLYTICSSLRQFMIENWRLLGGVRVGLSLCAGRDSLLCLLCICSHCLLHYLSS